METALPAVRHAEPYRAFARVLALSLPDLDRVFPPGVHPTAVVDPTADGGGRVRRPLLRGGGGRARWGRARAWAPTWCWGRTWPSAGTACSIPQVAVREGCRVGRRGDPARGRGGRHRGLRLPAGARGAGAHSPGGDRDPGATGSRWAPGSCIDRATTGATVVGDGNEDRQPDPDRAQCAGRPALRPERPDGHLGELRAGRRRDRRGPGRHRRPRHHRRRGAGSARSPASPRTFPPASPCSATRPWRPARLSGSRAPCAGCPS